MKNALALSMAAASVFGIHGAAAAEVAPECAPVYDQTLGELGHPSQELQDTIGAYASHDIEVHVQILNHAQPQGITSQGDEGQRQAQAYSKSLVEKCDWVNQNIVTVTVSSDPRVFRVEPHGNVVFDAAAEKTAKSNFTANLKDETSPYEADVTNLLNDISPYQKHEQQHDQQSEWPLYAAVGGGILLIGGFIYATSRFDTSGRKPTGSRSSSLGSDYYAGGYHDYGSGGLYHGSDRSVSSRDSDSGSYHDSGSSSSGGFDSGSSSSGGGFGGDF